MITEPRTWTHTSFVALLFIFVLLVAREGDSASLPVASATSGKTKVPAAVPNEGRGRGPGTLEARPPGPVILETLTVRPGPHVLDGLSAWEIRKLVMHHPERLGPASIGRPNGGGLLTGVQLASSAGLRVIDPTRSFGTQATVTSLEAAALEVLRQFPSSPRLDVGDISRSKGGHLRPHRSHQSGRDVDLGYYYLDRAAWYTKATSRNLDRDRTWVFLKALIAQGTVEYVFMDRGVQRLLREHAESSGENAELLAQLFESGPHRNTVFRHARGHLTHFHVRFSDPPAEATGKRIAAMPRPARRT